MNADVSGIFGGVAPKHTTGADSTSHFDRLEHLSVVTNVFRLGTTDELSVLSLEGGAPVRSYCIHIALLGVFEHPVHRAWVIFKKLEDTCAYTR